MLSFSFRPFEICADPTMPEITNFCLPGLMPALKHATAFLHEVGVNLHVCLYDQGVQVLVGDGPGVGLKRMHRLP